MTNSIANSSYVSRQSVPVQLPKSTKIRNDNALAWIYENLRSNQLVAKLRCLLTDSEHLVNCYEVAIAFFHSKRFVHAMFECLIALEKQQPQLLAQIDRNLYTIAAIAVGNNANGWQITEQVNSNDRQSTKIHICDSGRSSKPTVNDEQNERTCSKRAVSNLNLNKFIAKRLKKNSNRVRCKCKHVISVKLRPWVSVPDIRNHSVRSAFHYGDLNRSKSQPIHVKRARIKLTAENLAINEKRVPATLSTTPTPTKRNAGPVTANDAHTSNDANDTLRPINLVKCDDIKIHLDRRHLTHERSNDFATRFTSAANDCPFAAKSTNNLTTLFRILPNKKNIFPFLSNTNSSNTSNESGSGSPTGKPTADFVSFRTCNGEKIANQYRRSVFDELLHDSPPPISSSSSPMHKKQMVKSTTAEPTRGQTLTSYLQEAQRSRFNVTDLERENAHFSLCDAIISAIEEIKCGRHERQKEKQIRAAAIARRKNRVRPRRLKNWVAACDIEDHIPPNNEELNISDCESNISDSDVSIASSISSTSSSTSSNSSHVSSNSDTSTASKPGDLKYLKIFSVSSHSINDHAAYAEWAENSIESLSAEGIALSLISKFKDRQLPRAADLLTNAVDHVSTAHICQ